MRQKTAASTEIKRSNRTSIYNMLYTGGSASRQEIVRQLGFSLPTVTNNLNALKQEGLVKEVGFLGNTGGRRAMTYDITTDVRTAIGLDITRNHITAVAVDLRGAVIFSTRIRQPFQRCDSYCRMLGDLVNQVIGQAGLNREQIIGVGIGMPALITDDNQTIFYGKILDITGVTCAEFSRYIPFPTAMFNDANAAAFAEFWNNGHIRNAFYIMLSYNIGGAALVQGGIYAGENLHSCEVGHLTIVPGGRPCYCGKLGCVDTYCASSILSSQTDNDLAAFFARLSHGETQLVRLWDQYLDHLAAAVANVFVLFDCPIILGGYVGPFLAPYLDDLKGRLQASMNIFGNDIDYLQTCQYKKESIAAGAALHFVRDFLDTI